MATFVLVPGAWLGGWCWRRVTPLLEEKGHRVLTPTLTGLGERSHLLSEAVDLETHIQDVVNVMTWEDATNVILVGHSYAGFVVTGVADRVPDRAATLVYLDTSIPGDGEAFFDYWPAEMRSHIESAAERNGGWPVEEDLGPDGADIAAEDLAWIQSLGSPHPVGTLGQALQVENATAPVRQRAYIACKPAREQFADYLQPFRDDPALQFIDIESGHWPMFSAPEALASGLIEISNPDGVSAVAPC